MLVIDWVLWDPYWLFLLLGVLSLYLAYKRPGLSYGDAYMVIGAVLAGTCAGLAAVCLISATLDKTSFLYSLFWGFELPYLVFGALVLAALRTWKKRSGLFDYLLLLGCLLPFGRMLLFLFIVLVIAIFGMFGMY